MHAEESNTEDGRRVLRTGEYIRKDYAGYQYKVWSPATRRYVSCCAKTLEELREKEPALQNDVLDGVGSRAGKNTLDDYYQIWVKNKRIKRNVLSNYVYTYKKFVSPVLGSKKLKGINYTTVQSFYLDLLDSGRVTVGSLQFIHTIIHQILEQAVRDDVIAGTRLTA